MNFLSVLYAKAGITVDGVTTLNNTATGLTPATNDNSTNIATTAFVKNQNYYPYPTGTTSQYVRGDGSLATFTQTGGGGSSVSYYLNGSVSQGTIGGNAYYEMSKTAVVGTNADFTINANGYIAQFVTDAGDPALLNIPGGNWNFEMFFSASSGGGSPSFYVQLYKYDGTTLTLIASGSAVPESITGGTSIDLYVTALAVPTTTLTLTDRLAVRVYVTHSGRTITLHTQNGHLCQVITTFTTGLTALNGLTAQVQNFAVGAGGSDFNISSVTDTHTFNLPTASATKRGALSSIDWSAFDAKVDFGDLSATSPLSYNGSGVFSIAQSSTSTNGYVSSTDWNTFNNKIGGSGTANYIAKFTSGSVVGNSIIYDNGTNVGIGTNSPQVELALYNTATPRFHLQNSTSGISSVRGFQLALSGTATYLWNFENGATIFGTNNTERMRITDGGNVVIGTTSGSFPLTVVGKIGANIFSDSYLEFSSSGHAILKANNDVFVGYSQNFVVKQNGYVGVGTANPLYRLESTTTALFGTTAYGVLNIAGDNPAYIKIKTNIPFSYGNQGYTVNIKGFQYGSAQTLDLQICWHQYIDLFTSPTITSKGSFAPVVRLARESGLVVIVLTWGQYWPKLYVESVHNYLNDGYANGWTWVDENVTGDKTVTLSYKNDFGDGFVKTAAGLVGIGTNSPSAKLDVQGTNSNGLIQAYVTSGGGNALRLNSNFGGGNYIDLNPYISGVSNGGFEIKQNGTQRFVIADATGNVGIGTTNPLNKLQVVGGYISTKDDAAYGGAFMEGYNGIVYFGSLGTDNISLYSSGDRLFINGTTGNIGIGTTTDAGYKLDVNGTGRFNGGLVVENNSIVQDGTRPIITLKQSGTSKLLLGISSVADDIIVGDVSGDVDFRTNSQAFNFSVNNGGSIAFKLASSGAATFSSSVTALGNAYFGTFNNSNKYYFEPFTNLAGGANNAYLVSSKADNNERSGFVFQARNSNGEEYNAVIIEGHSSTSTTTPLTIEASGAATFSSLAGTGDRMVIANASGTLSTQAIPSGTITGTGTANYITKWVSGSAVGNSGLSDNGTTISTTENLTIKSSGNHGLIINSSYTPSGKYWSLGVNYNNADGELVFIPTSTSFGDAKIIFQQNGNVLIGTTTDAGYKLYVNGQARIDGFSGNPALQIRDAGSTFALMGILGSQTGDVNWLLMSGYPNAGDFTIRQSDTVNALTLAKTSGAATFSSSVTAAYYITSGTGTVFDAGGAGISSIRAAFTNTGGTFYIGRDNSVGSSFGAAYAAILYESGANPMVFWTNATERMRITSGGNVLIGTVTDAGYKLDVNGTGRFVNQLRAYSLLSDTQIKGSAYVELSPDQGTYNAWNIRVGAQAADNCYYITGGGVNILTTEGYNNPYTVKLYSNGIQTLTMTNGAATFSSSVNATSFTANNRTTLTSGGLYDNATNGNDIGFGFGAGVIISTNGVGTYSAQNLGNATYPWYSARFADRVTSLAWTTTGRNYSNEWIEFPNASGLYSPINGAYFFPNTGSSYGAWAIQGVRNSYGGISFNGLSNGNVILMVYETSVETGFYNQANGWQFRWTSGTLYVGKGTYGGGTNAVVLDEVNFGSYALPLAGGTMTGTLTLQYDYPRINLYDTNHDSDYSIINNNGTFSIYDVTNNSHRLSIAADGTTAFVSSVTATNFIVPGGTSAQFLKADGSLDSSVYLTATSSTFSYTASVTLSPTWQNTGVSSTNLGTGAYLVTCNADDYAVGGGQYNCTYTGLMYFFAGATNGVNANEIVLHHTGHADSNRYIYLRTLNTVSADGKTYLQISGNGTNSGASNYQFTFKKLL